MGMRLRTSEARRAVPAIAFWRLSRLLETGVLIVAAPFPSSLSPSPPNSAVVRNRADPGEPSPSLVPTASSNLLVNQPDMG
jgi:hypothetical protein